MKKISDEERINRINEYSRCCSIKEKDELVKKYGYSNRKSLSSAIINFKRSFDLVNNTHNRYDYNTKEKRLAIVKTWDNSSNKEKMNIAKEHNTTYKTFALTISSYRKSLGIQKQHSIYRTVEEKIMIIEEYNKTKTANEKKLLAEKYNINYNILPTKICKFRQQLNIAETNSKKIPDDYKIMIVNLWHSSNKKEREDMVYKYNYQNYNSLYYAVNRYRSYLRKKGLI